MKFFKRWLKKPKNDHEEIASVLRCDSASDASPAILDGADAGDNLMGQGKKILVVDDNPVVLKAFEMKLKTLGFDVVTSAEGAGAVSLARDERPDVIVLDINFPPDIGSNGLQWNGYTIMQWMRRFHEAADIPVIIISSDSPEKARERALAGGASAFFQKPINNDEFLLTIRRIMAHAKPKEVV